MNPKINRWGIIDEKHRNDGPRFIDTFGFEYYDAIEMNKVFMISPDGSISIGEISILKPSGIEWIDL